MTEKTEVDKKEYRKQWLLNNKEKLALYARKQYEKRVNEDPEYRKVLVQRTLERRRRLREGEETKPIGRPRLDKQDEPKKASGRPRKYM